MMPIEHYLTWLLRMGECGLKIDIDTVLFIGSHLCYVP